MQYKEKAVTKRSTHYPLKEKAAVLKEDAERLPEGRSAEGSFQAGSLKRMVKGRKLCLTVFSRDSRVIPVTEWDFSRSRLRQSDMHIAVGL